MNHSDISHEITTYLSNSELFKTYLLGLIPSLSSLANNQVWWYNRCLVLSGRMIPYLNDLDWHETYIILVRELEREQPSLWNREDNLMAAHILIQMGYPLARDSLLEAALHNSLNLFVLFLKSARWYQDDVLSCIQTAAEEGHHLIVNCALRMCEVEPTWIDSMTVLYACAARWGNETGNYTKIVKLLTEGPRPFPVDLSQALSWSIKYSDNIEIVQLLLSKLPERHVAKMRHLLKEAIKKGRYLAARLFIQAGLSLTGTLKEAVRAGGRALQFLLEQMEGCKIEERCARKSLDVAIELGDVLCVDLLLTRKEVRALVDEDSVFCARVAKNYNSGVVELLEATLSGEL